MDDTGLAVASFPLPRPTVVAVAPLEAAPLAVVADSVPPDPPQAVIKVEATVPAITADTNERKCRRFMENDAPVFVIDLSYLVRQPATR